MKLCECGCGQPAPIAKETQRSRGYFAGQPMRFVAGHYKPPKRSSKFYRARHAPWHPKSNGGTCGVNEHVLVAERALGKYLPEGAEVHHVDGNNQNNANSNLVICQDRAFHKLLHWRARVIRKGGDPNVGQFCTACGQFLPFERFTPRRQSKSSGRCSKCRTCAYKGVKSQRVVAA